MSIIDDAQEHVPVTTKLQAKQFCGINATNIKSCKRRSESVNVVTSAAVVILQLAKTELHPRSHTYPQYHQY